MWHLNCPARTEVPLFNDLNFINDKFVDELLEFTLSKSRINQPKAGINLLKFCNENRKGIDLNVIKCLPMSGSLS